MNVPIRLRLTLAFGLGTALVLLGLGVFVYQRMAADLLASVDLGLRSRAQVVVGAIGQDASPVTHSTGRLIDPDESFAQVLDPSGRVLDSSSAALEIPLLSADLLRSVTRPTFLTRTIPRIDTDPVRLLVVPPRAQETGLLVVVGSTLGDRRDALTRLVISLAVAGPVALASTATVGWLVARQALRPVERMRREAEAISVSEPERRLPVPSTGDELARLGTTLNSMLERMQRAVDRERRFVDDASHELRTPLSILKAELDLALSRARSPEELESALRSASAETDRLVKLAQDLLVLARVEHGSLPIRREDIPLSDLPAPACAAYEARAGAAGVRIEVEAGPGAASVDPVRVRQALENLLDNALRHTPKGGVLDVRVRREGSTVTLVVEDSGPGFTNDMLRRAFEPFARADGEVGRDGAGAGLGLAIVRAVAEAHGGDAFAENVPEGGARLTVSLRG